MTENDFVWAVKSEGHLVTRKAGASAREQAKELREAAPVRTTLARLLKVHTDERAYRIGADGEQTVGSRLDRLMKGANGEWVVFHDIIRNAKGTNVDHLVVGPPGVFSLNTKHHPKAKIVVTEKMFRVNGHRTNYLPVAVSEAAKVRELLERQVHFPVQVYPVIVVMGAELEARAAPPGVLVVRRRDLPKWFKKMPELLPAEQRRELQRVAGRPATWRPVGSAEKLLVKSWSKYGKKRTYVNDAAGKTLGYRDEMTGEVSVDDANDLERVKEALDSREARH